jgi:hypothetical protein
MPNPAGHKARTLTVPVTTFAATSQRLLDAVDAALPVLLAIDDAGASAPRAPGKWSRKQILGHLIDSAGNNHQRFVRAQEGPVLVSPDYQQEHWVRIQGYADSSWLDLVTLWTAYNRHLAQVVARIPEERADQRCVIGDNPPATLAFVAADYADHMWHHLRQIGVTGQP